VQHRDAGRGREQLGRQVAGEADAGGGVGNAVGRARASATSSATLVPGTERWTVQKLGATASSAMGAKAWSLS
jgi:hypothetical protein